jgi:hypothetical protein
MLVEIERPRNMTCHDLPPHSSSKTPSPKWRAILAVGETESSVLASGERAGFILYP